MGQHCQYQMPETRRAARRAPAAHHGGESGPALVYFTVSNSKATFTLQKTELLLAPALQAKADAPWRIPRSLPRDTQSFSVT